VQTRAPRRRDTVLAVIALVAAAAMTGCTGPVARSGESVAGTAPPSSGRCRVMGPGSGPDPEQELTQLREACERALAPVARVWPGWSGTALVVVADSELEAGTAAYVEGLAREGEPAEGERLVVAPGLAAELSEEGLDIVLRHELTHLAMRSTGTPPLPLWATEGLATHVGYASVADARRERRSELERLRDRVETGAWAATVPDATAFEDPDRRDDAYTAAWLGVETLLEHHGRDRVTASMRRQHRSPGPAGTPITDADRTAHLLRSLGVSREWLDEQWRSALDRRTS
jgi:HAMP domain-containing protein